MLRCDFCRAYAHAGLGHLHGTGMTLCRVCSEEIVERRRLSTAAAEANVKATRAFLQSRAVCEGIPERVPTGRYEHTELVLLDDLTRA